MSDPSIVQLPDLSRLIHEINPRVTIPIGWWRHSSQNPSPLNQSHASSPVNNRATLVATTTVKID
jgi:hypothetical protein